jgi:hypothetical protein
MLVVLSIILTLAVVTILLMPRFQERQKVPRGADLLQGWLLMAKQRAIRDQIPTGIRLQSPPSPANPSFVRDLQYIRKPDDYAPSAIYSVDTLFQGHLQTDPPNVYHFGPKVNLLGSAAVDAGDETSLVQAGDYLQLRSAGLLHRIEKITGPQSCIIVASAPETPPPPGCPVRIIRQPRLLPGEQALQLPQDVIIDVSASLNVPSRATLARPTYGYWEILFSPSGTVMGQGTGNTPIGLLLRDGTLDPGMGDQTLIAIYPRTGAIASQPLAAGADPFQFLRDGRAAGF